jgi:hypothetical protein
LHRLRFLTAGQDKYKNIAQDGILAAHIRRLVCHQNPRALFARVAKEEATVPRFFLHGLDTIVALAPNFHRLPSVKYGNDDAAGKHNTRPVFLQDYWWPRWDGEPRYSKNEWVVECVDALIGRASSFELRAVDCYAIGDALSHYRGLLENLVDFHLTIAPRPLLEGLKIQDHQIQRAEYLTQLAAVMPRLRSLTIGFELPPYARSIPEIVEESDLGDNDEESDPEQRQLAGSLPDAVSIISRYLLAPTYPRLRHLRIHGLRASKFDKVVRCLSRHSRTLDSVSLRDIKFHGPDKSHTQMVLLTSIQTLRNKMDLEQFSVSGLFGCVHGGLVWMSRSSVGKVRFRVEEYVCRRGPYPFPNIHPYLRELEEGTCRIVGRFLIREPESGTEEDAEGDAEPLKICLESDESWLMVVR